MEENRNERLESRIIFQSGYQLQTEWQGAVLARFEAALHGIPHRNQGRLRLITHRFGPLANR